MDRTRNPFVWIAAFVFRYGWCCFIAVPVLYLVEDPALKFLLIAAGLLISLRVPFLFDVCSLLLIMALLQRLSANGAMTAGWYLFFGAYSFQLSLNVQQHYRRFRQRPGAR